VTDREVYQKLAGIAEELGHLAAKAETYVGQAALSTAASTLAGTAKAIYEHAMGGEEH
jgi:hypothetical protein